MRVIVLSVVVAVLGGVGALSLLRRLRPAKALPVTAKPLLGRPEQVLYGRLVRAFPGHVILAHVALSRLLAVDRTAAATEGPAIATRGRQLVADFVVCRPDFTALAVVELEDRAAG